MHNYVNECFERNWWYIFKKADLKFLSFSLRKRRERYKWIHSRNFAGIAPIPTPAIFPFTIVAKRRDGTQSVALASVVSTFSLSLSLPRYSFSLNKLEADILQGRPGQLHKKTWLHTCGNSPRPSFPLGPGPLSTPACYHFSLPRERHPAVMRSFTPLANVTMSFCSRGKPLHFLSHCIHTLPL